VHWHESRERYKERGYDNAPRGEPFEFVSPKTYCFVAVTISDVAPLALTAR
jgi:hypothetical protein